MLTASLAFEVISSYRSFSGWFFVISQPKNGLFDQNYTWSQGFEEVTSRKNNNPVCVNMAYDQDVKSVFQIIRFDELYSDRVKY